MRYYFTTYFLLFFWVLPLLTLHICCVGFIEMVARLAALAKACKNVILKKVI